MTTRVGILGPSAGNATLLREALEFLLFGNEPVSEVVYLGSDGLLDRVIATWTKELIGTDDPDTGLMRFAKGVSRETDSSEIRAVLRAHETAARLGVARKIAPPPAVTTLMFGDRLALAVFDKSVLDGDDIASAQLVLYGKNKEADLRRFGPRFFFSPGPVTAKSVGVVEIIGASVEAIARKFDGSVLAREQVEGRQSRVAVMR